MDVNGQCGWLRCGHAHTQLRYTDEQGKLVKQELDEQLAATLDYLQSAARAAETAVASDKNTAVSFVSRCKNVSLARVCRIKLGQSHFLARLLKK